MKTHDSRGNHSFLVLFLVYDAEFLFLPPPFHSSTHYVNIKAQVQMVKFDFFKLSIEFPQLFRCFSRCSCSKMTILNGGTHARDRREIVHWVN